MLALRDKCIHPTSQKPYIKSFSGGKNNSPEGHSVCPPSRPAPNLNSVAYAHKGNFTHGFVVEFESEEDRDYYVYKDPAHQDFVKLSGEVVNGVKVIDYEPGKL